MPESAKECDTVLPEGLDIGLGPGDRAFEPHYSDQTPLKSLISEGGSFSLSIAAQHRADLTVMPEGEKRRLTCT